MSNEEFQAKEIELRKIMLDKHEMHNEVREKLEGLVDKPLDAKLISEYQRTGKELDDARSTVSLPLNKPSFTNTSVVRVK
jgi:hypothetical protein